MVQIGMILVAHHHLHDPRPDCGRSDNHAEDHRLCQREPGALKHHNELRADQRKHSRAEGQ